MKDTAIEVHDLKLSYINTQPFSIKNSFFQFRKSHKEKINALRGISFTASKGEVLGIVGKNGSGKSTLLQTLAGVFSPDEGQIDLNRNSISLLSLGAGFQMELNGRENILLNGLLLGFSQKQLRKEMDEIIEFSELDKFIDMPVYTYSSGMLSKLAFSITAVLETDIILVDELLAVGDAAFRAKSYEKMRSLIKNKDRTALIVSHQENSLRDLCDRVLWLDAGLIREEGDTGIVLDHYLEYMLAGN